MFPLLKAVDDRLLQVSGFAFPVISLELLSQTLKRVKHPSNMLLKLKESHPLIWMSCSRIMSLQINTFIQSY